MGRTKIIGIGNPLMADDGLGIKAVELLQGAGLEGEVEIIDGGTGGVALLYLMEDAEKVIFIDAAEIGEEPGTIRKVEGTALAAGEEDTLSLHGTGLAQVLALGREMGELPEIVIMAVQPCFVERHIGLSPLVKKALEQVPALVREELSG